MNQPERYTITIFEEKGVMHFHGSPDWGEYRKRAGLDPGVAVECSDADVKRWSNYLIGYGQVQIELREILNANKPRVA